MTTIHDYNRHLREQQRQRRMQEDVSTIVLVILTIALIVIVIACVGLATTDKRAAAAVITATVTPITATAPAITWTCYEPLSVEGEKEERPFPHAEELELVDVIESLGEFRITVYTPYCDGGVWGYQTATGVRSQHLVTCAVDPRVIPLGSVIQVGELELVAVDIGSAVNNKVIDIFFDGTQQEAIRWIAGFGTQHEVFMIMPKEDTE